MAMLPNEFHKIPLEIKYQQPNICLFELNASGGFAGADLPQPANMTKVDADGRHGHSGKTETTIFIARNSFKSKLSIRSLEMIEG